MAVHHTRVEKREADARAIIDYGHKRAWHSHSNRVCESAFQPDNAEFL
jgi:hypothetical protein